MYGAGRKKATEFFFQSLGKNTRGNNTIFCVKRVAYFILHAELRIYAQ